MLKWWRMGDQREGAWGVRQPKSLLRAHFAGAFVAALGASTAQPSFAQPENAPTPTYLQKGICMAKEQMNKILDGQGQVTVARAAHSYRDELSFDVTASNSGNGRGYIVGYANGVACIETGIRITNAFTPGAYGTTPPRAVMMNVDSRKNAAFCATSNIGCNDSNAAFTKSASLGFQPLLYGELVQERAADGDNSKTQRWNEGRFFAITYGPDKSGQMVAVTSDGIAMAESGIKNIQFDPQSIKFFERRAVSAQPKQ